MYAIKVALNFMKNGPYELIVAPYDYPGKKYRGRYAYEHIVVWWIKTGELPTMGTEIHHINGDHRDNDINNLVLLSKEEHTEIHRKLRTLPRPVYACGFCGVACKAKNNQFKWRSKNRKYGKLFCSISCGAKHQHQMSCKKKVA